MGKDQENNEISQISFYLAKPKATFELVIDLENDPKANKSYRSKDFAVGDAKCRFIYFEKTTAKYNPPWLNFINDQLGEAGKIAFQSTSESPNGILLVEIDTRLFAATFGRSAGSCLARKALEPDFGIKTAMNMCGNEEIRQTKSQSNTITTTQIDRQVNKPSDSFVFGLSEGEDLKYISAHMRADASITLQGRDNLTIKVINRKLNWQQVIAHCRDFLKAYAGTEYADLIPKLQELSACNRS